MTACIAMYSWLCLEAVQSYAWLTYCTTRASTRTGTAVAQAGQLLSPGLPLALDLLLNCELHGIRHPALALEVLLNEGNDNLVD